jgi:hypothetical protein
MLSLSKHEGLRRCMRRALPSPNHRFFVATSDAAGMRDISLQ